MMQTKNAEENVSVFRQERKIVLGVGSQTMCTLSGGRIWEEQKQLLN